MPTAASLAWCLRDLVVALPHVRLSELMETHVVTVRVTDSAKLAAEKIARYDLGVLPVINGGDRLVGIVTADDAMDVAEAESTESTESTESFHRVGIVSHLGVSLRDASTWLLFQKRMFWLVLPVFGNIFSGAGIAFFEDTIAANIDCQAKVELHLRALLLQSVAGGRLRLMRLASEDHDGDPGRVRLTVELSSLEPADDDLEQAMRRFGLEPGVSSIGWKATTPVDPG